MTDMRDLQPNEQTLDISGDTKGNHIWQARIEVWPYSFLKNETVYTRNLNLVMRADNSAAAHGIAISAAKIISLAHDVWQANVRAIEQCA